MELESFRKVASYFMNNDGLWQFGWYVDDNVYDVGYVYQSFLRL